MWFTAAFGEVGNEFKPSWTEDILKRYNKSVGRYVGYLEMLSIIAKYRLVQHSEDKPRAEIGYIKASMKISCLREPAITSIHKQTVPALRHDRSLADWKCSRHHERVHSRSCARVIKCVSSDGPERASADVAAAHPRAGPPHRLQRRQLAHFGN
jgi:hypothetical protein